MNISGLRHREAAVRVAPSDPVPLRAPGWCWTHVSLPGCRDGAQGIRALPALHGSPPALEPEAGWRPSLHGRSARGLGAESLTAVGGEPGWGLWGAGWEDASDGGGPGEAGSLL